MRFQSLAVALSLLVAPSCAGADDKPTAPAPTTATGLPTGAWGVVAPVSFARGTDTEYAPAPADVVVRDAEAWKELWTKAHAALVPQPPPPAVDFSREMVVAVFAGEKPSTGYSVEITHAQVGHGTMIVVVREKAPAPGTVTGSVLTYPFHIVRFPACANVTFRRDK